MSFPGHILTSVVRSMQTLRMRTILIEVIVNRNRRHHEKNNNQLNQNPRIDMGNCQNYGPFLGTLNIRCRIILRTQNGTIILTTTHRKPFEKAGIDHQRLFGVAAPHLARNATHREVYCRFWGLRRVRGLGVILES